jgi:hypothetical protein
VWAGNCLVGSNPTLSAPDAHRLAASSAGSRAEHASPASSLPGGRPKRRGWDFHPTRCATERSAGPRCGRVPALGRFRQLGTWASSRPSARARVRAGAGSWAHAARSPCAPRGRATARRPRPRPGYPAHATSRARGHGRADRAGVQEPLARGDVQRHAGAELGRAGPARRLLPRGRDVCVRDKSQLGALSCEAADRPSACPWLRRVPPPLRASPRPRARAPARGGRSLSGPSVCGSVAMAPSARALSICRCRIVTLMVGFFGEVYAGRSAAPAGFGLGKGCGPGAAEVRPGGREPLCEALRERCGGGGFDAFDFSLEYAAKGRSDGDFADAEPTRSTFPCDRKRKVERVKVRDGRAPSGAGSTQAQLSPTRCERVSRATSAEPALTRRGRPPLSATNTAGSASADGRGALAALRGRS